MKISRPCSNFVQIGRLGIIWYRWKDWKHWKALAKGKHLIVHRFPSGVTEYQVRLGCLRWGPKA